jgi:glycerate dehydrogenase
MKIVVVDQAALNPGDLRWDGLEPLGEVEIYPRTDPGELLERIAGARAVLTNKVAFPAETLGALDELEYIGVTATGYNVVDVAAARAAGVTVTNVPTYATRAVAQATFALLLAMTNHVARLDAEVRTRWPASEDFAYWDEPIVELAGRTLGIVGFGRIGRAVAEIGRAMGMEVIAAGRREIDQPGIRQVDLDALFETADVVSLHCRLTEQTAGLVGADRLARMKPTAYLLNTGRGRLVDEAALAEALSAGRLAGAGLDVLSAEPPGADNPLLAAPRCVITPHVAWAATAARRRLLQTAVDNLAAWIQGRPQNVVS